MPSNKNNIQITLGKCSCIKETISAFCAGDTLHAITEVQYYKEGYELLQNSYIYLINTWANWTNSGAQNSMIDKSDSPSTTIALSQLIYNLLNYNN